MKLYMFRTVRLPTIRSLFTVNSALVYTYVIQVCRQLSGRTFILMGMYLGVSRFSRHILLYILLHIFKPVWHIPVLSVQWINSCWWTEKLPETCRVSCRSKFGKLGQLVGFIIKKTDYPCLWVHNPGVRSPCRLYFFRWRLIFVGTL